MLKMVPVVATLVAGSAHACQTTDQEIAFPHTLGKAEIVGVRVTSDTLPEYAGLATHADKNQTPVATPTHETIGAETIFSRFCRIHNYKLEGIYIKGNIEFTITYELSGDPTI